MVSVTKLISILDKPALVGWANKIGLKGINIKDYQSKSKTDGNNIHKQVEDFLNHGIEFKGCEKLKKSLNNYNVLGCEVDVNNGYILGRIDIVLEKDGKKYVCDLKSNKYIYISTKLQLSAYKHLLNADYICFINTEDLELRIIDIDTSKYFEIIKRLYQINKLITSLNEKL